MGYIAIDLGASSGRAILGSIKNGKLNLQEVYRFSNGPQEQDGALYWDIHGLLEHIKCGIQAAYKVCQVIKGIAVDTWGVDFGLLNANDALIQLPKCYRDAITHGYTSKIRNTISNEDFYRSSGIQQMDINTVYQLLAMKDYTPEVLEQTKSLLFTPDLLNFMLTGVKSCEYTIASTSQLLDACTKKWDTALLEKLDLPSTIFSEVRKPGTHLGMLKKELTEELNIPQIPVYLVGSHDTASAIGAIPMMNDETTAFLSSGTWSLLGVTSKEPYLTAEALKADFTNEGGVNDRILFMRNITGLWVMQQVIEEWKQEPNFTLDYDELFDLVDHVAPFQSIIDTDDKLFNYPKSMVEAVQTYCQKTKQHQPKTKGEIIRCILESLALKYALIMDKLKACTNRKIDTLYIVGGGSLNVRLNQYIANALDLEVITGLTEGTAIGNIMQQAIASKEITNWTEAHQIISNTYTERKFKPNDTKAWANVKEQLMKRIS